MRPRLTHDMQDVKAAQRVEPSADVRPDLDSGEASAAEKPARKRPYLNQDAKSAVSGAFAVGGGDIPADPEKNARSMPTTMPRTMPAAATRATRSRTTTAATSEPDAVPGAHPSTWALAVGICGLVVGIMALRVHFERPVTAPEINTRPRNSSPTSPNTQRQPTSFAGSRAGASKVSVA
jgi:hypothetical protein